MRRLFLSLYSSIAAAVFLFVVAVPFVIERGLQGPLLRMVSAYGDTPQKLLEAEFANVPEAEWPVLIQELQQHYGYEIELHRKRELQVSGDVAALLDAGAPSVNPDLDLDNLLIPIRGSDYVVSVTFEYDEQEKGARGAGGFYYLIEKQTQDLGRSERGEYFRSLTEGAHIPVREVLVATLDLDSVERENLDRGFIVSRDIESDDETYFKASDLPGHAIVIGPNRSPFLMRSIDWFVIGLLALIFGATIFLWLRPLIRDMQALDEGATEFGEGRLDARVSVSKRSSIHDLASTFNAMAGRIRALIRAQKELTDAVSHELRTPISRLRFGMFKLENSQSHDDWQVAVQGMNKDIDELDQLVDELLTYSRLKNVDPSVSRSEVRIETWLDEITRDVEAVCEGVRLDRRVDADVDTVVMDARLMARALSNLIRNAAKFARSAVQITVQRTPIGTEFIVEDDGDGIAEADIERVFEPFTRLNTRQGKENPGYGLGLAIVKRICEWHGANVVATASSMGGAKFVIDVRH